VKDDTSFRLEDTVNAVIRPSASVALEHGIPSISVQIEGEMRVLIIDTGSNISILQPGISKKVMRHTNMRPYGVKGETLDVKAVSFVLGGREFNHQLLVCCVPTEAKGLLSMDFLKEPRAIEHLECNKMSLADIGNVPRANGKTLNKSTALAVFIKVKGHSPQPTTREARYKNKQVPADPPHERIPTPATAWLVKARKPTPWHLGANKW
jgi:hypothetical protein